MNWKLIIGVPAIILGSTLVVLAGYWVFCLVRRRLYGPPPPRQPTDLDLQRMTWDFPTIIATIAAALTTVVSVLSVTLPASVAGWQKKLGLAASVGGAFVVFMVVRALIRKLAMPPSDENRR